jgi:hypothetical protein
MTALPLTYKESNCFINAYINKNNAYKTKNLKYVIGSVAFNGFWEFGGEKWGKKEFEARHTKGTVCWDAHAWLEDEEGNIYDQVFPFYNYSAKVNTGKKTKVADGTLWEGISKAEAAALGITYKAADKETQVAIFISLFSWLRDVEANLKSGKSSWMGSMLSTAMSCPW